MKSGKIPLMNGKLSKEKVFEILLPVSTDDGACGKLADMLLGGSLLRAVRGRLDVVVSATPTMGQKG